MNALRQINAIFAAAARLQLTALEQLVLMHLYNKFNRSHWQATIALRDSDLLADCGLNVTLATLRRAKARLKAHGLIDYVAGKGSQVTVYHSVELYGGARDNKTCDKFAREAVNERVDTPVDTPVHTETRIATGSVGTCENERVDTPVDTSENSYLRARAQNSKSTKNINKGESVREEILKTWRVEAHYPLSAACQRQIPALLNDFGKQSVIDAIETVREFRTCLTFADVKELLNLNARYTPDAVKRAIRAVQLNRAVVTFAKVEAQLQRPDQPKVSHKKSEGVKADESLQPDRGDEATYALKLVDTGDEPWANY